MLHVGKPRILAIIPARGGSKGLPGKNLYPVGPLKEPLIEFTVSAATSSEYITDTFICTEDRGIQLWFTEYCQRQHYMKNIGLINRPNNLALDNTPIEPVINYCLSQVFNNNYNAYDFILLLQPASPLRSSKDINAALALYFATDAISMISVNMPNKHPFKSFIRTEKGFMRGIINDEYPFMNRQQLPITYESNGAIYLCPVNHFLQNGTFFSDKTKPYVMPAERSVDVDTLEDIKIVEKYLGAKM